jgi:hypothetical protein
MTKKVERCKELTTVESEVLQRVGPLLQEPAACCSRMPGGNRIVECTEAPAVLLLQWATGLLRAAGGIVIEQELAHANIASQSGGMESGNVPCRDKNMRVRGRLAGLRVVSATGKEQLSKMWVARADGDVQRGENWRRLSGTGVGAGGGKTVAKPPAP